MERKYYYFADQTKIGPLTIVELQRLALPLETMIWMEGLEAPVAINDSQELMNLLLLTPPAYKDITEPVKSLSHDRMPIEQPVGECATAEKEYANVSVSVEEVTEAASVESIAHSQLVTDEQTRVEEISNKHLVEAELPGFPTFIMGVGMLSGFAQLFLAFINNDSILAGVIDFTFAIWGMVSIGGMLAKKKWGLISFFAYRILTLVVLMWSAGMGVEVGEELGKNIMSLLMVIGIFFITKNGYNTYEILWNNGMVYEENNSEGQDESPAQEETSTENNETV